VGYSIPFNPLHYSSSQTSPKCVIVADSPLSRSSSQILVSLERVGQAADQLSSRRAGLHRCRPCSTLHIPSPSQVSIARFDCLRPSQSCSPGGCWPQVSHSLLFPQLLLPDTSLVTCISKSWAAAHLHMSCIHIATPMLHTQILFCLIIASPQMSYVLVQNYNELDQGAPFGRPIHLKRKSEDNC
jgi:hypothetical protein